uniref:Sperm protein 6kDa n=1 Tax=Haliotis fulgens TaxID=6456 RepID=M9W7M4_HALFU|nr:sperm protein 6kDa [Haliotis fulgens]
MRVVLIVTAVFLIISLTKCVSGGAFDDDDTPENLVSHKVIDARAEEELGRRRRSADLDYGGGYADSDGSESLLE